MAQVPAEGHPDRWLYEELRTIQQLLLVVALQTGEHDRTYAGQLLAEAQKRVAAAP